MVATTIKQYAWVLAAIVALSAALAVLSPGIAEAQSPEDTVLVSTLPESDTQVQDNAAIPQQQPVVYEPATLRVVNPGDSLWAISQERLQPDPTPEQIMNEVGRIYELNQDLIGNDPNLIFAGQELLLPPVVVAEFPVSEEPETPGSGVSEPVTASEPAVSEELVPPEPAVSGEPAASQEESETSEPAASKSVTSEQVPEPDNDKDIASNAPTDKEAAPTSGGIVGSLSGLYGNTSERQLLGLGIGALTLVIAILGAWKLPMDRSVEDSTLWRMLKERVRRNGATHYHGIYPRGQEQEAPPTGAAVTEPAPSREGTVESAAETPTGIPTTPSEDARRLRARRFRALRLRTRRKSARSGYEERSLRGR